jgi:hypothetical protein
LREVGWIENLFSDVGQIA